MFADGAVRLREPANEVWTVYPYHRELPARELAKGTAVVEEYALCRRTAVMGKVHVLTP